MPDLRFMLDSNICIYATKGVGAVLRARLSEQARGSLAVSTITLAEITLGYRTDTDRAALRAFLDEMELCSFDVSAAQCYATLPFRRGAYDRLIAAHAMALDLTLVTNNERDFADVAGLRVENWTQ